ncbi:AAA family ATPase [Dyella amyloliquefaciens]|uniref:AAA family ATPase n=1 Tax=Dyella amyloliquefaciens TaxID=1770545 RepID=UPI00102ED317|nr:fimbrial protein [Dyella amyloliquefaciens]
MQPNATTVVNLARLSLDTAQLLLFSPQESSAQRYAARLRHLVTLSWCDSQRFANSRQALDARTTNLVLLDFSAEHADNSIQLARQLVSLDPALLLVGMGVATANRGAGVLAAMRAGLKEFIDIDAADEVVLGQLRQLMEQARHRRSEMPTASSRRGQLVLVCGVRPGLGSSTLSAHLAATASAASSSESPGMSNNILVLDLGHSSGDVGLYLGVHGEFHFDDAVRHADRLDATLMRTAVGRHGSGASVLGLPLDRDAADVGGSEALPLLERLLSMYDVVLCDFDVRALAVAGAGLVQVADEIWLIGDQAVGSMVALDSCLRQLERAAARDMRVSLVVNRYDEACGISGAHMAERFNLPLLATLPERSRPLRSSANQGVLLHEAVPADPYIRALRPLLSRLRLPVKQAVSAPHWKVWFNRFKGSSWKRH